MIATSPYKIAERFRGIKEVPGSGDNAQILAMLKLDASWPEHDEVPWCSAFPNYVNWLLGLPRSRSLMARSWLRVGVPVDLVDASVGFDIAVLSRGSNPRLGHVGYYAGHNDKYIYLLSGNSSNTVEVDAFAINRLLGIRRTIL